MTDQKPPHLVEKYFVNHNGTVSGPHNLETVKALLEAGQIGPDTLISDEPHEANRVWETVSKLVERAERNPSGGGDPLSDLFTAMKNAQHRSQDLKQDTNSIIETTEDGEESSNLIKWGGIALGFIGLAWGAQSLLSSRSENEPQNPTALQKPNLPAGQTQAAPQQAAPPPAQQAAAPAPAGAAPPQRSGSSPSDADQSRKIKEEQRRREEERKRQEEEDERRREEERRRREEDERRREDEERRKREEEDQGSDDPGARDNKKGNKEGERARPDNDEGRPPMDDGGGRDGEPVE